MPVPIDDLTNLHLDAPSKDPSQARAELNAAVLKIKALLAAITETGASNALKLDSNGNVAQGVNFAGSLNIPGNLTVGNNVTDIRLQSVSNAVYNFAAKNAVGSTVYFGATAGATANAQISNVAGTAIATFKNDLSVDFASDVNILNTKSIFLGGVNGLDVNHDGNANINNSTGLLYIRNLLPAGLISMQTPRTSGVVRDVFVLGGAVPVVKIYGDGFLEAESVVGGFNIVNKLQIDSVEQLPNDNIAVPNYVASTVYYKADELIGPSSAGRSLNTSGITSLIVGPTVSNPGVIWTELDSIPLTAKWIEFTFHLQVDDDNTQPISLQLYATAIGSAIPLSSNAAKFATLKRDTTTSTASYNIFIGTTVTTRISVNNFNAFNLRIQYQGLNTGVISVFVKGFGV